MKITAETLREHLLEFAQKNAPVRKINDKNPKRPRKRAVGKRARICIRRTPAISGITVSMQSKTAYVSITIKSDISAMQTNTAINRGI